MLLLANRLYKRRTSATGIEGFGPEGLSVQALHGDAPDVARRSIEQSLDMTQAGVALMITEFRSWRRGEPARGRTPPRCLRIRRP